MKIKISILRTVLLGDSRKTGTPGAPDFREFLACTAARLLPFALLMTACSEPPKPQIPSLTPEVANQVLHYNSKASSWIAHAKTQDPSCEYDLDIPDQSNHPAQLDFSHIVKCGGRKSPLELDASVSFEYDKDTQHWVITRFSD